jgi:hypothetical protein
MVCLDIDFEGIRIEWALVSNHPDVDLWSTIWVYMHLAHGIRGERPILILVWMPRLVNCMQEPLVILKTHLSATIFLYPIILLPISTVISMEWRRRPSTRRESHEEVSIGGMPQSLQPWISASCVVFRLFYIYVALAL